MSDDRQKLVDCIYEAAIVPAEWPSALDQLAQVGEGVGGLLFSLSGGDVRWTASPSLQDQFQQYLIEGWPTRTDRAARLLAARHAGFLDDLDVYTEEELQRQPVFAEFLRPRGLGRGAATGISVPTGDTLIVSIERDYRRGPASRLLLRQLDEFRPHLARAALLSARLRMERARSAVAALGLIGLPAAVLGTRGQVLAGNELFQPLIPTVARDHHARLTLADAVVDALLSEALRELQLGRDTATVRSMAIPAATDRPPLILHLVPIRGSAHDVFGGAGSIIVVTPVQPRAVPNAEVLEGLFDLTPAEARVARAIAAATRIADVAGELGVSQETVRTQLKAVLGKTGVGRQADLVALLSGLALCDGDRI